MSAFRGKVDMAIALRDVCFWLRADISRSQALITRSRFLITSLAAPDWNLAKWSS